MSSPWEFRNWNLKLCGTDVRRVCTLPACNGRESLRESRGSGRDEQQLTVWAAGVMGPGVRKIAKVNVLLGAWIYKECWLWCKAVFTVPNRCLLLAAQGYTWLTIKQRRCYYIEVRFVPRIQRIPEACFTKKGKSISYTQVASINNKWQMIVFLNVNEGTKHIVVPTCNSQSALRYAMRGLFYSGWKPH